MAPLDFTPAAPTAALVFGEKSLKDAGEKNNGDFIWCPTGNDAKRRRLGPKVQKSGQVFGKTSLEVGLGLKCGRNDATKGAMGVFVS